MLPIFGKIFKKQIFRVEKETRERRRQDDSLASLGRDQLEKLKKKGLSIPVVTI